MFEAMQAVMINYKLILPGLICLLTKKIGFCVLHTQRSYPADSPATDALGDKVRDIC